MSDNSIYVEIPKSLPVSVRRNLRAHCRKLSPEVRFEVYESRNMACADWLLPAVIIISVAKPLVDGFLKELGAQGAKSLSSTLKALFTRAKAQGWRSIPLHAFARDGSIKRPKLVRACPILSIETATRVVIERDTTIRFVWPETLSESDAEAALKAYAHAVKAAIKSQPKRDTADRGVTFRRLFVYNPTSRKWQEHKET